MKYKEIDKLVAEKVLGWKVYTDDLGFSVWSDNNDHWHGSIEDFQPSNNIEHAWKIVKKLQQEEQYYFKLENGDLYDYECHFKSYSGEVSCSAEADTAELAICKAALNAVGVSIK